MKTLQHILILFLSIALMVVLIGFLLPHKVHVARTLIIHAPAEMIFEQINSPKHWKKWSPWLQSDTLMPLRFIGPESGAGGSYSWHSADKNVGSGNCSIICSVPCDSLLALMDFGESGKSTLKFKLIKVNQNTNVTLSLDSNLGLNPLSRWFGLFADHLVGPDLEKCLLNLNKLLVDIINHNINNVQDIDLPARVLLTVRDTASPETVSAKLSRMYKVISVFLKQQGLSPTGVPIAIFHDISSPVFDIEACIPIASAIPVPKGLNCFEDAPQRTVMVKYFGPGKLITGAYSALNAYINERGLMITGPPWEEYVTNPTHIADSNLWQTNIYYPVRE